eukprot:CAMPEP_0206246670 /NCGR_PEP_ID=MMETSP0047_2-20121206/19391_1 /ASSEMBLY_ACC=CAM_ASM_000192 /TAXON_ID=195065 /ORGANISM="Chroomonas mesostigmatica_cf, Strain CCMP1168" /LENGTH=42 /DNA_ID= /DNA_START= /DNA_END= /DNA_ORIENTATION=
MMQAPGTAPTPGNNNNQSRKTNTTPRPPTTPATTLALGPAPN